MKEQKKKKSLLPQKFFSFSYFFLKKFYNDSAIIVFYEYNNYPPKKFFYFSTKQRKKTFWLLIFFSLFSYLSSFHKTKIKNFLRKFSPEWSNNTVKNFATHKTLVSTCTKFVFNWHQTFRKSFYEMLRLNKIWKLQPNFFLLLIYNQTI